MTSNSICPFCLWAACGLILVLLVPGLGGFATTAGPALLWLVLIPFASALLRRGLHLTMR